LNKQYKYTLVTLKKLNIPYCVGADSLVGFENGNIFEYSTNLKLFIYPLGIIKFILLFILLILNKIILKPKLEKNRLFYKLRFYSESLNKNENWLIFYIIKPKQKFNNIYFGNKDNSFQKKDLSFEFIKYDDILVSVPKNSNQFVNNYKNILLSDFYKNHEIEFDSLSEKKAINLLYGVVNILENTSLNFWIEGGTLLGAIRDEKLIPWDHDLDMGIINSNNNEIRNAIKLLKKEFYVSVKSFKKNHRTWILGDYRVIKIYPRKLYFFKEKLCLDLFVYYKGNLSSVNNEVYKYVVWDRNGYHKKEYLEKLDKIIFYGKQINIPKNAKGFLEVKYGKDWETPQKQWNVALDDGSIVRN